MALAFRRFWFSLHLNRISVPDKALFANFASRNDIYYTRRGDSSFTPLLAHYSYYVGVVFRWPRALFQVSDVYLVGRERDLLEAGAQLGTRSGAADSAGSRPPALRSEKTKNSFFYQEFFNTWHTQKNFPSAYTNNRQCSDFQLTKKDNVSSFIRLECKPFYINHGSQGC